ncbi:replicative DNA helicase [Reticulibacter mediterranei]|uniref:Replicative DNA helicase n=1 Tax=Reticulibacter mediterranei TaxID=2778369 RepID=A0A8J3INI6_9CHLR|nr:replicative DNA helicase [Reticulibacter mediterranei]GHO94819.1 replicative DNA helicase [Reticulibacter mediterranei]
MMERALPFSIEAEEGVLGSLLIDPDALDLVMDLLSADDFYRDAHRTLYETILTLAARRELADFITLCNELERGGKLKAMGGRAFISSLVNVVPTSGNIEYYGRIVALKALARRLIHVAGQIAGAAYTDEEHALETAEQLIFALGQSRLTSEFSHISTIIEECMEGLQALHERQEKVIGVPTGFHHLDFPLGGLHPSDLIILAARPAVGKTSFALSVASNAAYQSDRHVAVFSLEMSKKQLGMRLVSMTSQIDQQRLRTGWIMDEEWEQVISAMNALSSGHLWIDDTPALSVPALRSKARRLHTQHPLDLIVVDYLQLMHAASDKRSQNREQEIAEISRGLKAIAKELQVPVLALAQLSRAVESRRNKFPQLSDLRESGAIENDADVVLFIYREELYDPENIEARGTADIIIAKHRNGPVGTIRLGFDAARTRFHTLELSSSDEIGSSHSQEDTDAEQ